MENKSRIFIAIPVPSEIKKHIITQDLQELKSKLQKACRPVKSENIHLTLHFIGHIEETKLNHFIDQCTKNDFESAFKLKVEKRGCFPDIKNPGVFFSKITDPDGKLMKLHESISEILNNNNISIQNRKYNPHLTLAYIKNPETKAIKFLKEYIHNFNATAISFKVESFNIYSSTLKPQGAEHKIIKTIKLA